MTRVSMKSVMKALGIITLFVLVLGLAIRILGGPASAQEPTQDLEYFKLDKTSKSLKEGPDPRVEYEALAPAKNQQTQPDQAAGYLDIYALDMYNHRPVPGLAFHVYDRNNELITEVVSGCERYVELSGLAPGYYQVIPQPSDEYHVYYGRSEWVYLRPGYRARIYFYSQPAITSAGIRINAYDRQYRYNYVGGAPFSIYDYDGELVYTGVTNCSGYLDFYDATPGWYRVVEGGAAQPQDTPAPPTITPPPAGVSLSQYDDAEGVWVPAYAGYLVSMSYYVDPASYAEATPTVDPEATPTETPGPGTPTATVGSGTNTPTSVPPTNTPTQTPTPSPTPEATDEPSPPPPPPGTDS